MKTTLKRNLGLTMLTFYGIGMILGAGIYSIVGKAAGLVVFIYLGITSNHFTKALLVLPSFETLSSASLVVFAYLGFENIVNLSEEAKNPERNIPRAILLSLTISTGLYILVSLAAVALLSPDALMQSKAPLVAAAIRRSPFVASLLGGAALFSTANTALIALVSTSRILFGVSKDGALPAVLSKVSTSRKTPWVAALTVLAFALCLLPLGKVEIIASVSSFATLVAFIAVNTALIVLRYSQPDLPRPFKVPLAIGRFPVLPCAGAVMAVIFLFQFSPMVYLLGGLMLVLSVVFGFVFEAKLQKK